MNLAVSHDVLCKRLGIPAVIVITSHHIGIAFCITVHNIANQDQQLFFEDMRHGYYENPILHVTIHQLRRLQLLHVLVLVRIRPILLRKSITLRETLEKRKNDEKYFTFLKNPSVSYGMQVNYSHSNGASNRRNLKERKKESKENCKER